VPTPLPDPQTTPIERTDATVLRLVVRNHPGVLSHVSGLFARRAFNVDGILCLPIGDGARSAILLLVRADDRLEQLVRQLAKLEDVLEIRPQPDGQGAFAAVAQLLQSPRT
jgi:acetolactate synthase I/III small subunit